MEPTPADVRDAEDCLLCDVETFSDWLSADCIDSKVSAVPSYNCDPDLMTVPELLAAVIGSPWPKFVFECAQELRTRYLKDKKDAVNKRAAEIRAAIQEDEHEGVF